MQNNSYNVAIILPVYNGAQTISGSIESVIAQSYTNWHLLIIDDGSIDATAEIVKKYSDIDSRIIYLKNETNLGIQKTLNKGIGQAVGEYIARIDADDVWSDTEKLAQQIEFFDTHIDHVLVGTGARMVSDTGQTLGAYVLPTDDKGIRERILGKNCFVHASVVIRRDALLKVGMYNENKAVRHVEDHELWLRLGMVGKFANLPTYMTTLTVSSTSITAQHRVVQAKRMFRLCTDFRKKYPRFVFGYILCICRLLFFVIVSIIPIPKSLLYRLQEYVRAQ